jgi:hypothetical protein
LLAELLNAHVDAIAFEAANSDHLVVIVVVNGSVAGQIARRCDGKNRIYLVLEANASGLADHLRKPDCLNSIDIFLVREDKGSVLGVLRVRTGRESSEGEGPPMGSPEEACGMDGRR